MADTSQTQLRILRGSIGYVLELHGYGSGYGDGYGYGLGLGLGSGYSDGSGYGSDSRRSDNGLVPLPDSGLASLPDSN
jgi:hypothetical protein